MMRGVVNLLKPPGMSSAQAVAFIKRLSGLKTGHAGTLDPEAAGVLPILLGRATRISEYLMAASKTYLAEIAFGSATDTQDAQGKVTARGSNYPTADGLTAILPRFTGSISQLPPQYSALKVGERLPMSLPEAGRQPRFPREVEVYSLQMVRQLSENSYLLRAECGKGTYIRTLCHDIGEALGCPAHMRLLVREQSGGLSIQDACTLEDLKEAGREGLQRLMLPVDQALAFMPQVAVPHSLLHLLAGGVRLSADDQRLGNMLFPSGPFRLYAGEDFLGVFELRERALRARCMLYLP